MKISLILASSTTDPLRKNDPFKPLALPLLAATAPDHEYHFTDLLWENSVDLDRPADLVAISVRSTAEKRAYKIADELRKRGRKVVVGGPQVSAVPFRALRHADAVAVGEGEPLWPVIVKDAEADSLRDFYVCSPEPFDAGERSLYKVDSFADLDGIPGPLHGLYRKKYVFDTVFAVRGCPVDCDFCSVTRLFGPRFRTRPIPDVVAEIDSFRNYYYLLDDSVFGRPPVYDYYLELYEAVAGLKKKRYWTGQANLHAAGNPKGRRVIEKAVEAGLLYAAVGMESINPATLERCGAIAKAGAGGAADVVAAMKDNIRFMQDLGIIVSGWFVLGYEDDTIDTYYETIEFCREMNILPAVFPVKALPGTRLHERLKAAGRLDDTRLVNVLHPTIKDEEIFAAMEYMRKEGYSLKENLKRARHYFPRFGDDRIHKTIFLMVLQSRLKVGLDVSRDEFYVDPDLEE